MASKDIMLPKDFDLTKMAYGQVKQLNTGGKTIFISYGGNPLILQTPEMKAPFGVSRWEGENGGPDKYNLDLSFDGAESREAVRVFMDVLKSIDRRLIKDAMEAAPLWFKKKFPSEDVVNELYTRTLRMYKDPETGEHTNKYPPTFKMQLPLDRNNKFAFPVYNGARSEVDLMDMITRNVTKGARVQAIVQLTGVWIVGSKFGLSWKTRVLKISEPPRLNGYAFKRTEEDGPEEEEADDGAYLPDEHVRDITHKTRNVKLDSARAGGSNGGLEDSDGDAEEPNPLDA